MKKNTIFSIAFFSASALMINAQEAPKELVWQNSGGTSIWSVLDTEWGEDIGVPEFLMPSGWQSGSVAIFNGAGKFADAEGNPLAEESIKVSGAIEVGNIKFNSDKNYSIAYAADKAADKLTGNGSLIKEGTGNLTLNVLNALKGGTIVRGGQVILAKADSPNAFGDTIVLENGAIGVAPTVSSTPAIALNVPVCVPEGKTGAIYAGRYAQFTGNFYGKGALTIYTGGERVYVTNDKAGKKDMTGWKNFEGELILDVNPATLGAKPGYMGLQFSTTKTFGGVDEMTGIDSTFVNTKITLKKDAGLTSVSGTRCFAIGELNAEGGFLSGYGSGSSNPIIWWSIGNSNTDVTLPLWLRDNTGANKNSFGVIKEGTGTYIFTGDKNAATGKVFLGLHVKKGAAYINTPVDDATITALCRNGATAMTIYEGAIGGGNGRITGGVVVDGGKLEIGCQGIGQLILADTLSGATMKSPLTVKKGSVEFEISSIDSYDKLSTNNAATFNGNKIVVKVASSYTINDGDSFIILDSKVKTADDAYAVEFENVPANVKLTCVEESYQSGTKVDAETQEETPVMGYRLVVKATGTGSGVENQSAENQVVVYAQDGNIQISGAEVQAVTVMNNQGQVVATSNSATVSMNASQGLYIVKIKTAAGIVVKKVIL